MKLQQHREALRDDLEGVGIKTYAYIPERFQPPIAVVTAGIPYLTQADTTCEFELNLAVTVVADKSTNVVSTDTLDDLIEKVIIATGDWYIEEVEEPFILEVNNATYLASKVHLNTTTEIGGV